MALTPGRERHAMMRYRLCFRLYRAGKRVFIAAATVSSLLFTGALAAGDEPEFLGVASDIVLDSIRVGPDGKRFAAVTVDPLANKRRVIVNCRNVAGAYDRVAQGTPIFSPEGSRMAFVASRDGKCYVVVDGVEGRGYEIIENRWPIANLIFSRGGRHIAYMARKDGKNYLVVDEREFGPYDDEVAGEAGDVQGIWDFQFNDDEKYFSYRAKTSGGMVACRGRFMDSGEISLTTSNEYENIGAGTPIWLGGAAGGGRTANCLPLSPGPPGRSSCRSCRSLRTWTKSRQCMPRSCPAVSFAHPIGQSASRRGTKPICGGRSFSARPIFPTKARTSGSPTMPSDRCCTHPTESAGPAWPGRATTS